MRRMSSRRQYMCHDANYRVIGDLGDPCAYCGVESTQYDHVPPLHYVSRLSEEEIAAGDLRKYPSCNECNSALTGQLFLTLNERRAHILEFLRAKYRKFLRMPQWDEDELGELDTDMADDIRRHEKYSRWIKSRIGYYRKTG